MPRSLPRLCTEAAAAGAPVRVVGCGTSEHGAQAMALILAAALAREGFEPRVEAAQAFEAALAPQHGGLVVGISHEGGTWATNRALEAARAAGSRTALVTVSDRSPGAALADLVVTTEEADQSWCHTIGYLSPVLAALAVAGHVTGKAPDAAAVRAALAAGAGGAEAAERVAARLADASHIVVIASGPDRPAARELALKIEEATWLPTTMRDLETFLHGHLPATDATTGLVLILADGDALDARADRAAEALAAAHAIGLRAAAILSDAAQAALLMAPTPVGRMRAALPVAARGARGRFGRHGRAAAASHRAAGPGARHEPRPDPPGPGGLPRGRRAGPLSAVARQQPLPGSRPSPPAAATMPSRTRTKASRSPSGMAARKCSSTPRRWVGEAARRRRRPASVRTANAPRASVGQARRST